MRAFLVLVLAFLLQIGLGQALGFWPSFVLSFLVTAAFFLNLGELLVLALLGVFLLNWQPVLSPELIVVGLFPFVVFSLRRVFPWGAWISVLAATASGVAALYLVTDYGFILRAPLVWGADLASSLIFALLAFLFIGERYS